MSDNNNKKDSSLFGCMMDIPDPRAPYNQRHKFIDVVMIVVTAVLSGMDTWSTVMCPRTKLVM